jgi:putative membrane protein
VVAAVARRREKKGRAMNNEKAIDRSALESDPRIPLAFERTLLAYERTQIAWVRTALSLISFGFAIAKVFQMLRVEKGPGATLLTPRMVGLLMISIGLIGLMLAHLQQRRAVSALRRRCPDLPRPVAGVMSVMIGLLGFLALISALIR